MSKDLIYIKEKYGEKLMHLCRKNFSTLLETDGLLFELLSSNFAYSKFLYDDIVNNSLEDMFKNYIYSLMETENEESIEVLETPYELLNDAGYDLYECLSEEDIQTYRKYYSGGEELCSFRGGRLDDCYVFFAIKKDVNKINREDFINPMRQDKYGTSVISIQFTKGKVNTLSIKNRYNHRVDNPDATFSNNLENIIPGLTRSFEREYNLNINQNLCGGFEIPGYVKANDGKYYKYNYEINNIYYCPDNIIIDNFEVVRNYQEKEKYIIIDYFIVDLVNKKVILYDKRINDSFIDGLYNIKRIDINKDKITGNKKLDVIFLNGSIACIEIDKYNKIISYKNDNILKIKDNFLYKNIFLENIDIPNVLEIGDSFLTVNMAIKNISFNKLLSIGSGFLSSNKIIDNVELDSVMMIGDYFLSENVGLTEIDMVKLEKVGNDFLEKNKNIIKINLPNLTYVVDNFLRYNVLLEQVWLPNLGYAGNNFMAANKRMYEIFLPMLNDLGDNFLYSNRGIKNISLDNLNSVGNNFMFCNRWLKNIYLPKLKITGIRFLYMNDSIVELELSELVIARKYFMSNNNSLKILLVPNLRRVEGYFLDENDVLEYIDINIEKLDGYVKFLDRNVYDIKKMVLKP